MEISVNVTVDFSEGAKRFLERLLGCEPVDVESPLPEEEGSREEAESPGSEAQSSSAKGEGDSDPPFGEPYPEEAEIIPPTDEEMRQLMDIQITRITGTTDWKESDDARVKSLRRSCTACFKDIAKALGADRPTSLQGEARTKFINHIELISVNGDACEVLPF